MDSLPINTLDAIVIVVLLLSGALAALKGFVDGVLGIGAWIGAYFVAVYGLVFVKPFARDIVTIAWVADIIAGVGLFILSLFIFNLITGIISNRVQSSKLNSLDRSLGMLFGLLRGVLIICVVFLFAGFIWSPANRPTWMADAKSLPLIDKGVGILYAISPRGVAAAESATKGAAGKANQAIELDKAYRQLTQPDPAAVDPGATKPGYSPSERQGIDRLFQSNN